MRQGPPEGGTGMVDFPSAKDFVMSTYCPRVAVLVSPAADAVVAKSNLKFADLLMPFTKVSTDVMWGEPVNGQLISPKGIKFMPVDIGAWKPGNIDSQKNKKQLNSIVAQNPPPLIDPMVEHSPSTKTRLHQLGTLKASTTSSYSVEVPSSSPWFDKWREMFLRLHAESQVSQYDFLHHFTACILVISSAEVKTQEELAAAVDRLNKMQQQHQSEWPNTWTFSSVLKFYLIVHERNVVDQTSAESIYQSLRTTYGGNFCFMMQLQGPSATVDSNSVQCADVWSYFVRDETIKLEDGPEENHVAENDVIVTSELLHPLSPDLENPPTIISQNGDVPISLTTPSKPLVRGKFLVNEDLQSIQLTVDDFITKALLPYIERQSRLLHESIVNRRGMSKSFFSATKRLFGTGGKAASLVFYAHDSLEMMSRKLADVYFLFGHYAGSYQLYHQLKKDFLGDSAYAYFASSLEMAAVSHFMMSQIEPPLAMARAFPVHYISDAISHYVDHCRMMDSATKCALICCECLRQMDNNGEAATIYIRMTSEECDLRSALMLEQAAYTFLRLNSPRKYALHCVLAGHRYSKAGFRKHSLNCYFQAAQIYKGKGWRFAEDHVNFTIARHQSLLQMSNSSISKHLQSLLITPSPQPSHQIQGFYKEYLTIMNKFDPHGTIRREFFIPKIQCSLIRVRIAVCNLLPGEITFSPIPEDDLQLWDSLEDQVVKDCVNSSVMTFKPSRVLFHSKSDNTVNPQVPCDETFYVEVPLQNPLCIPISLRDIKLHFNSDNVQSSSIHELELQPEEIKMIRFAVCASSQGVHCYEWLHYDLELSSLRVPFKLRILMKGPRLSSTIAERVGKVYAKDLRNQIKIVEKMPLLQAQVENIPATLYHAQSSEFSLLLKDVTGDTSQRDRVTNFVLAMDKMDESLAIHSSSHDNSNQLDIISKKKNFANFRASPEGTNGCRLPCYYKAPQSGEHAVLNMLLVYAFNSVNGSNKLHRIIKVSVKIPLTNCLKLQYATLKLLNANTYIGLLRTHNLTPESTITIQKISFNREELSIINSYGPASKDGANENENACLQLAPMASRNTILKVQVNEEKVLTQETFILVNWQVSNSVRKDVSSTVSGCNKIQLEDIYKILSVEENSLVFELRHKSSIQNDFSDNPCLIFPVELLVHSRTDGRVTIHIDRTQETNSITSGPGHKASKDTAAFIGPTSWALDVHRMTSYPITFTVAVTHPGVYNIGPTLITTRETGPSTAPTQRKYTLHSPLIVSQALQ